MRYTISMFALTADYKQITCIDGQGLDMCLISPIKDELEKDKRQFLDDAEKGGARHVLCMETNDSKNARRKTTLITLDNGKRRTKTIDEAQYNEIADNM